MTKVRRCLLLLALAAPAAAVCGAHRDVGQCYEKGSGSVKLLAYKNTSSADGCCAECAKYTSPAPGCQSWMWTGDNDNKSGENCHLKSGFPGALTPCAAGTSGTMTPAPTPAPPAPPAPTPAPAPAPAGAPHILFLFVDEMDGRTMDPAHPQLKPPLPNLERLAAAGVQFTTVYAESPQCVPSRASMMAGRRTDQIKVWDNFCGIAAAGGNAGAASKLDVHCVAALGAPACAAAAAEQTGVFAGTDATFLDRLRGFGYNVTLYGKMHVGAGLDENFPGEINAFPFGEDEDGYSHATMMGKELARPLGSAIGMKGARQNANRSWTVPDDVAKPATTNDYNTVDSCTRALAGGLFGDLHRGAQPQFLYCSILVPHPPYASNSTYMAHTAGLNITYPAQVPLGRLHPNDVFTATAKHSLDADAAHAADPGVAEHFRRVYLSMITEADELLGRVIDALDGAPGSPRARTFVIMISDHGEDAAEHRQSGKNNMYDSASRVPMIVSGPGIAKGSAPVTALASLNDVYPTLMAMARIPEPEGLAGYSVLDLVPSWQRQQQQQQQQQQQPQPPQPPQRQRARPDFVVAQYHSVFSVTGQFMVRQGDWKLIVYGPMPSWESDFAPQLFDLKSDPWELEDVAATHPDKVGALQKVLDGYFDWKTIDADAKDFDRRWFKTFFFDKNGGSSKCTKTMVKLFGADFNAIDAAKTGAWLGEDCK